MIGMESDGSRNFVVFMIVHTFTIAASISTLTGIRLGAV
jgi:hypothetical protein